MNIETEADINAATVRQLRESLAPKKGQRKFWGAICVSLSRGNAYETARTKPIPPEVRRLVYLHYVVGLPTDATKEELAGAVSSVNQARAAGKIITEAGKLTSKAMAALTQAGAKVDTLTEGR